VIRYRYVERLIPPAPLVNVSLRCVATDRQLDTVPAQVDTGADRTVLTAAVVNALQLVEDGRLVFKRFGSELLELPT
jgi:hypothetical protein